MNKGIILYIIGEISEKNQIAITMASETDWDSFTVVGAPGRDLNCNNGSGFSALPSGHRGCDGVFDGSGRNSQWWCTDEAGYDDQALDHEVYNFFWYLGRLPTSKNFGSSIRLVRDK
ncbi:MAG TPA: hypothetical protein VHO70_18650 [Chitinispirillaceae bacterium]|nr:hypothetical protein [Chitinispirillaceae bacterium]